MSSTDRTTTRPGTEPPMIGGVAPVRPAAAGWLRPNLGRLARRRLLVAAVLPLILLGLLAAMLVARGLGSSPTTVGSEAPDFALTDLAGEPVSLADLRGRPVIVNFWASWCVACLEEFPLLLEAHQRHADDGLAVVGIVYLDRSQAAREFMERQGATWTAATDPDGRVAEAYGILAPPETFLIDREGTITARALGQFTAAWLEEKVAAIMEE
jgi:cytochrome c biogenesis protein CcmG/thiol:disulfide interchange protein DsbE